MATKSELRPRAKPDIDRVGGERLLQFGAAGEARRLDIEAVLFEEALLHADIERHEIEGQRDGLADTELRIGRRRQRRAESRQYHDGDAQRDERCAPYAALLRSH